MVKNQIPVLPLRDIVVPINAFYDLVCLGYFLEYLLQRVVAC